MLTPATPTATLDPVAGAGPGTRRPSTLFRLALLELRLLVREPMVAVGLIAFPLVTVLVLAGVFGQDIDPDFGGVHPDDHYLTGYIGVVLAQLGLVTVPVNLATSRELGVLRRYRAAGVSGASLVGAQIIVGTVIGLISSTVVVVTGAAVYGLTAPSDPLAVVVAIGTGLLTFLAVGIAFGLAVPTGRVASSVGNLLFIPTFLLGGGGPPRAVLGDAMRAINTALPLSHVIGGIRLGWLGTTDDPHQLWYPLVVAVAATGAAVVLARRRQTPG